MLPSFIKLEAIETQKQELDVLAVQNAQQFFADPRRFDKLKSDISELHIAQNDQLKVLRRLVATPDNATLLQENKALSAKIAPLEQRVQTQADQIYLLLAKGQIAEASLVGTKFAVAPNFDSQVVGAQRELMTTVPNTQVGSLNLELQRILGSGRLIPRQLQEAVEKYEEVTHANKFDNFALQHFVKQCSDTINEIHSQTTLIETQLASISVNWAQFRTSTLPRAVNSTLRKQALQELAPSEQALATAINAIGLGTISHSLAEPLNVASWSEQLEWLCWATAVQERIKFNFLTQQLLSTYQSMLSAQKALGQPGITDVTIAELKQRSARLQASQQPPVPRHTRPDFSTIWYAFLSEMNMATSADDITAVRNTVNTVRAAIQLLPKEPCVEDAVQQLDLYLTCASAGLCQINNLSVACNTQPTIANFQQEIAQLDTRVKQSIQNMACDDKNECDKVKKDLLLKNQQQISFLNQSLRFLRKDYLDDLFAKQETLQIHLPLAAPVITSPVGPAGGPIITPPVGAVVAPPVGAVVAPPVGAVVTPPFGAVVGAEITPAVTPLAGGLVMTPAVVEPAITSAVVEPAITSAVVEPLITPAVVEPVITPAEEVLPPTLPPKPSSDLWFDKQPLQTKCRLNFGPVAEIAPSTNDMLLTQCETQCKENATYEICVENIADSAAENSLLPSHLAAHIKLNIGSVLRETEQARLEVQTDLAKQAILEVERDQLYDDIKEGTAALSQENLDKLATPTKDRDALEATLAQKFTEVEKKDQEYKAAYDALMTKYSEPFGEEAVLKATQFKPSKVRDLATECATTSAGLIGAVPQQERNGFELDCQKQCPKDAILGCTPDEIKQILEENTDPDIWKQANQPSIDEFKVQDSVFQARENETVEAYRIWKLAAKNSQSTEAERKVLSESFALAQSAYFEARKRRFLADFAMHNSMLNNSLAYIHFAKFATSLECLPILENVGGKDGLWLPPSGQGKVLRRCEESCQQVKLACTSQRDNLLQREIFAEDISQTPDSYEFTTFKGQLGYVKLLDPVYNITILTAMWRDVVASAVEEETIASFVLLEKQSTKIEEALFLEAEKLINQQNYFARYAVSGKLVFKPNYGAFREFEKEFLDNKEVKAFQTRFPPNEERIIQVRTWINTRYKIDDTHGPAAARAALVSLPSTTTESDLDQIYAADTFTEFNAENKALHIANLKSVETQLTFLHQEWKDLATAWEVLERSRATPAALPTDADIAALQRPELLPKWRNFHLLIRKFNDAVNDFLDTQTLFTEQCIRGDPCPIANARLALLCDNHCCKSDVQCGALHSAMEEIADNYEATLTQEAKTQEEQDWLLNSVAVYTIELVRLRELAPLPADIWATATILRNYAEKKFPTPEKPPKSITSPALLAQFSLLEGLEKIYDLIADWNVQLSGLVQTKRDIIEEENAGDESHIDAATLQEWKTCVNETEAQWIADQMSQKLSAIALGTETKIDDFKMCKSTSVSYVQKFQRAARVVVIKDELVDMNNAFLAELQVTDKRDLKFVAFQRMLQTSQDSNGNAVDPLALLASLRAKIIPIQTNFEAKISDVSRPFVLKNDPKSANSLSTTGTFLSMFVRLIDEVVFFLTAQHESSEATRLSSSSLLQQKICASELRADLKANSVLADETFYALWLVITDRAPMIIDVPKSKLLIIGNKPLVKELFKCTTTFPSKTVVVEAKTRLTLANWKDYLQTETGLRVSPRVIVVDPSRAIFTEGKYVMLEEAIPGLYQFLGMEGQVQDLNLAENEAEFIREKDATKTLKNFDATTPDAPPLYLLLARLLTVDSTKTRAEIVTAIEETVSAVLVQIDDAKIEKAVVILPHFPPGDFVANDPELHAIWNQVFIHTVKKSADLLERCIVLVLPE